MEPPSQFHAEVLATLHAPRPVAADVFDQARDLGTEDAELVYAQMEKLGRIHSVPPWSAPRVAWRDMLIGDVKTRSGVLRDGLMQLCSMIRGRDYAPLAWSPELDVGEGQA